MKKQTKITTTLLILFTTALLLDLTLTIYNLSHFNYQLEANPLIKGPITIIILKTLIFLIALGYWYNYPLMKYNTKFSTITFLVMGIIGQLFGAYSHIGMIQATHQSTAIIENQDSFIIQTPQQNYTITKLENTEKNQFYSKTIGLLLLYPMIFALIINYITQWSIIE